MNVSLITKAAKWYFIELIALECFVELYWVFWIFTAVELSLSFQVFVNVFSFDYISYTFSVGDK